MWSFLVYGAVLGFSGGLSPGPLLALVVSQTLQHGTREGLRIAVAPLLTDLPIICIGLMLYSSLGEPDFVLGLVSFIGCAFIGYLGVTSLRQQPVELDLAQGAPRSYLKGALANALSPHPYLFWLSVGVPTMVKAISQSQLHAVGFVVSFYVCMLGTKMILALFIGRSRNFLTGAGYIWAVKCLGVLLIGFSVVLFYDGLLLTGFIQ
jgi:threonine/homoserine/homoserine lactone efflux protein